MKKERSVLKTYFATNKIPTADNFGELIDSAINQAEDGIKKDAGNPVAIQAEGMGDGVQDVLYFYKNFNDENPSWRINQNPRIDPKDPSTNKPGLNFSDATGRSRLFIKSDDGNVGIGTITPSQKLSVNGNTLLGISDNTAIGMDAQEGARLGIIKKFGNYPQICSSNNAPIIFAQTNQNDVFTNIATSSITERMRIDEKGNVGIGTGTPGFPLNFANSLGDKISLWGQYGSHYGFGIQPSLLQIHSNNPESDIAFGFGTSAALYETMRIKGNGNVGIGMSNPTFTLTIGTPRETALGVENRATFSAKNNAGAYEGFLWPRWADNTMYLNFGKTGFNIRNNASAPVMFMQDNGNVGIGTTGPVAKLQVAGGAIMPAAGNSAAAGIQFPNDPGGGGGDSAWIRYYVRSGEAMTLELGTANDGDDHIALMPSGNVGIGTNTPSCKLDVVGAGGATKDFKVNGRMQTGDGTGNGGIWLNGPVEDAFVGNVGDSVGFWTNKQGWNALCIKKDSGFVGIGTTAPRAKLEVFGSAALNYGSYGFLGRGGASTWAPVNTIPISIIASDRIIASEYDAISDARIKKDFSRSKSKVDIETLNSLVITDYRYKDEIEFGTGFKKGFIAQEVEQVFPEAVSRHSSFIPNIFSQPEVAVVNGQILFVTMKDEHGCVTGDTVRLIVPTGNKEVKVTKVTDKVFSVNDWMDATDTVFVYGKKVDDFRTIDYNAIFTLGVSAIQELYRQVQHLKEELSGVKEKLLNTLIPAI